MTADELLTEYRVLVDKWQAALRRDAAKSPFMHPRLKEELVAEYFVLSSGSAHHMQASGWRMVVDVIAEKLVDNAAAADLHDDPKKRDTQVRYAALQRCQLAYPFIAAWRLCLEVALKETIEEISVATGVAVGGQDKTELGRHRVDRLWTILDGCVVDFVPLLTATATRLAIADPTPGFDLDKAPHDAAVQRLVDVDPDGQSLRYAKSLKGQANMANVTDINLTSAHQDYSNLYAWLQHVAGLATSVKQMKGCEAHVSELTPPS